MKVTLPWVLYIDLIRIQGDEGLNWDEACVRASLYLDPGKKEFIRAVEKESLSIYKSRFMTEMNKSRKKWVDKGYKKGVKEYMIVYQCSICGKELVLRPGQKDHEAMKKFMKNAGWAHSSCIDK
jgi:hypothetical protein